MSLVRVVIICLASTHTALVSSPSLAVLHLSTYLPSLLGEKREGVVFSRPLRALRASLSVYVALTNIPVGELLTGFAMRSDPNVVFG